MNRPERLPSRYKPYLWVLGEGIETLPVNELVGQRFRVIAPHIWLDTQPELRPPAPDTLPPRAIPYLKAHPYRLHVPGVYGILEGSGIAPIVLLDNSPIHPQSGELLPSLETAWAEASPVRQIHWLWQIWELWPVLSELGVANSLLKRDNVRIEGWRVRLQELVSHQPQPESIAALAEVWQPLAQSAHPTMVEPLTDFVGSLHSQSREGSDNTWLEQATARLNQLLLAQAAQVSVRVSLAGATSAGPTQPRNEDTCFPDGVYQPAIDSGAPCLGIVCDGVGGHAGGEVASQLAVQSLQLQLRALLTEAQEESQVLPPTIIKQQIEAVIRIVNDVINHQNDNQSRAERQRMGTTLAMAVVVPQRIETEQGWMRVDELYIAHVGDSRAYWITPDYCHLLTVDHDIAGREVIAGRQLWSIAQERPDAGALTQAVGTRSTDYLHPFVQRFIVDETGVLLLCSDGLSDYHRVEDAWANYIGLIVKDIVSLESAVASWIELANQKNGHDNAAVVLMHFKATTKTPVALSTEVMDRPEGPQTELTAASRALLYGETPADSDDGAAADRAGALKPRSIAWWVWLLAAVIVVGGAFSLLTLLRPPADPNPGPVPSQNEP
ncbi:protein phosphatase 2C domain-containing protein [Pseudanabaena sp. FACHB-2040]|uniref:PP2C family protein-serine/threonine phosphatase n=1 Tax=Pseudanabaena sp. FACHB-2040 TaxID=2692859 RepID=UPI001684CC49|nr:protein phosphatase 2C domain-containing protein [Pseudanabaena sp. FACHB-2040]MBD2259209.1 protein phosphatase 2C domain-containing protein [Pseudanabaena sp. FACHB-2040]